MREACERQEELEGHVKIKPLSTGSIDFPKGKKEVCILGVSLTMSLRQFYSHCHLRSIAFFSIG